MEDKILNEFYKLKIKNIIKLQEYVTYCIDKNQSYNIPGKTSHHHILPNKLFKEYSNLKENTWNGVFYYIKIIIMLIFYYQKQ